ncbi:MAG: NAD(P)-binding domain-containing protein, partial [Coriobacteriia bacterium]
MAGEFRFEGSLAVVGGGRMGEAIVGGLLKSGVISAGSITIAEPDAEKREMLAASLGVACVSGA